MIPDIGLMIAAYNVTRMAAPLGQPHQYANPAAKVLAALTILATIGLALDLVSHGIGVPAPPLR